MNRKQIGMMLVGVSLLCFCSVGCGNAKDGILSIYEKTISSLGDFQRTDSFLLRGTREDGEDAYTGTYRATCRKTRAKDVVFGGCSTASRELYITGTIGAQEGVIEIYALNGTDGKQYFTPNMDGTFSGTIRSNGGDCYLVVDYADFTGTVTLQSSYTEQ